MDTAGRLQLACMMGAGDGVRLQRETEIIQIDRVIDVNTGVSRRPCASNGTRPSNGREITPTM